MTGWLNLTPEQRKAVIDQAEQLSGISAKAIEKDWWVTLTLKALFQSAYKKYLVFKGGTSLSKGWKIIARFSEDIDLALDPQAFGMMYNENPSKSYVDKLKRKGCEFTSEQLRKELEKQFGKLSVPDGMITIEAAPVPHDRPDTDPQILFIKYPPLYERNPYIPDDVKIEVSVRSLGMPFTSIPMQSLLYEINPKTAYAEIPFEVETVEPHKTFLEKIFLLHEEFRKPDKTRIRTERMSRHLYDLYKMAKTDIETNALSNHDLYDHLIKHRKGYSRISWLDYTSLAHHVVNFLPPDNLLEDYSRDYATMREEMIYEEVVPFQELVVQLKLLKGRLRLKHEVEKAFDEIIDVAKKQIISSNSLLEKQDGSFVQTTLTYNQTTTFDVLFLYKNGELIFEDLNALPE